MPLITDSSYSAGFFFKNGHFNTLHTALRRKPSKVNYQRERILTPGQDFIDLDWVKTGSQRLIIVTHGLEGSSQSSYIRGFVNTVSKVGWDCLAWNLRGCSGVPNLKLKSYHSGSSDDLQLVFSHALFKKTYHEIVLVGFSLGGNITLKFLGEQATSIAGLIACAVTISVPCDLEAAAQATNRLENLFYRRTFLHSMRTKLVEKQTLYPHYLPECDTRSLKTFFDFDNYYTAPVHGFRTAKEYWRVCSSKHYLQTIAVPTLILNAADDPLLAPECFPIEAAKQSQFVHLETPRYGGHVGFKLKGSRSYWSEMRTLEFLSQHAVSNSFLKSADCQAA